ncbi:gluconokinase [Pararhizobium mangrovi]|uniref:Gluconokinase n=1 Tax=Pararhizobium mangrovi TaxID=2590452 RepID=A0A506U8J7_9HYPH|nr:gluconokinase [Pararhizobium mangrovi]TPW28197.1 gluconokinase [Pararhizobium mangrovi]
MGVSGSGKSSVGSRLASQIGARFVEGDELHPPENVRKMESGTPLDDADRSPWLERVGTCLRQAIDAHDAAVVACSALKRSYRDTLREAAGGEGVAFVYLEGDRALLARRMSGRSGHFMPTKLLDSQLATLEVPHDEPRTITVSVDQTVEQIVVDAIQGLRGL